MSFCDAGSMAPDRERPDYISMDFRRVLQPAGMGNPRASENAPLPLDAHPGYFLRPMSALSKICD